MDETTDIDVDPADIAETPPDEVPSDDGQTTTVTVDSDVAPGVNQEGEFYANLAETLSDDELNDLAEKYLNLIDEDIEARKKRDDQYADGLKKTGIAEPAPGGASFEGASRATHPVLAESYVDFAASSIKELFPPNGPVRSKIEGKPNHEKTERANRKTSFLNWQLTEQVKSYRGELERLLTQLPAGGTQFFKLWWNEDKKRIDAEFIPIDDFILPYNAKNYYDCQRRFIRLHLSELDIERKINSGDYRDWSLPAASAGAMEDTKAAKQTAKIEGKEDNYSTDDVDRFAYEGVIYDQIGDAKAPEDRAVPYIITIDHDTRKVLGLYRNWEESDTATYSEIEYIVDYNFIPWRGAYGIGLPQLIGGLSDALTGALRALLDSALIANSATALKVKGTPSGSSNSIDVTQVTEIDTMGDDIRKMAMPLPFPGPSPVLFELLGFLTQAAKGVVSTAEEKIAEASNQMPVGTALALIEQGAKVFSSIHARLHDSQRRALEIIHRLNKEHLPEKLQFGSDPDDYVMKADFEGPMDVRPVSDPNIFSETQRFAQVQAIFQTLTQLATVGPQLQPVLQATGINLHALLKRSFELMKFPDYEEILPDIPSANPTDPCDENIALAMGGPVKAFEGQDHQAHIQVHADFATSPFFGLSPAMSPTFGVHMMNHIQDHLFTFYQELMKQNSGMTAQPQGNNSPQAAEALAKSSAVVAKAMDIAFAKIPGLMQQGIQHIKAMQPKPPPDPMVAVAAQNVQMQGQLGQAKIAQQAKDTAADIQQKTQSAMLDHDEAIQKAHIQAAADLEKAARDNDTARWIAILKELSGHVTQLRDGMSTEQSPKESA